MAFSMASARSHCTMRFKRAMSSLSLSLVATGFPFSAADAEEERGEKGTSNVMRIRRRGRGV